VQDPNLIGLAEPSGKASVWGFGSRSSPHHNFMEMNRFFLDCRLGRDDDLMRLQSRLSLHDAISDVRQASALSAIVCDRLRKSAKVGGLFCVAFDCYVKESIARREPLEFGLFTLRMYLTT
jgi:hypothetical protein